MNGYELNKEGEEESRVVGTIQAIYFQHLTSKDREVATKRISKLYIDMQIIKFYCSKFKSI